MGTRNGVTRLWLSPLPGQGVRDEQVANRMLWERGMAQEAKAQGNGWDTQT
jgi:hypothetical protein